MPVVLVPEVRPARSLITFQHPSLRFRLTRLAASVARRLLTVWRVLFADVRRRLDPARLAETLTAPHLLDAEQYVTGQWQADVEQPARLLLPLLFADVFRQTATALAPELTEVAGQPVQVRVLPETQQEEEREAGAQITAVTTTTLLGLRHLLRGGRAEEDSRAGLAHRVQTTFGLTPLQVRQLDQARQRWQQEGRSAAQIQQGVEEATARGLSHRLRTIAQTQAYRAVNLAHRLGMTQAAQVGGALVGLRRYWHIQPGACMLCSPIPAMNPQGVPVTSPFATPVGMLFDPPLHPACRCTVDYRQGG